MYFQFWICLMSQNQAKTVLSRWGIVAVQKCFSLPLSFTFLLRTIKVAFFLNSALLPLENLGKIGSKGADYMP